MGGASLVSLAALKPAEEQDPYPALPLPLERAVPESELEFYTRRALEERRLASCAATGAAAAAHLYLAASYSARIAREMQRESELELLALSIP